MGRCFLCREGTYPARFLFLVNPTVARGTVKLGRGSVVHRACHASLSHVGGDQLFRRKQAHYIRIVRERMA
jgi:hypothetical protein